MKHTTKTYFNPANRHETVNRFDEWRNSEFKHDEPPSTWVMIIIFVLMVAAFMSAMFLPLVV